MTIALLVGISMSECGACGRNADPSERAHAMRGDIRGRGCGAVFGRIASGHPAIGAAVLRRMRPDLEVAA